MALPFSPVPPPSTMNPAFSLPPHLKSLSPQQLQMLLHFMQPNALVASPPTPGPDHLPANPYAPNIVQGQFGLLGSFACPPVAQIKQVHPNLEMASEVDSHCKELAELKSVLGQKRGMDDSGGSMSDADDEGQVKAKKARKMRMKVVKRYITGVKNLSTHQATVHSELTVSLITCVGAFHLSFPRL